jgi:hypothetical protein
MRVKAGRYNPTKEVTAVAVRAETKADDVEEQPDEQLPPIIDLTPEESWADFEAMTQKHLGLSADDFLAKWYGGEYDAVADDPDHRDVLYLGMLASVVAPR